MYANLSNRQIKSLEGQVSGKRREILKNYFISISFIYTIFFAFLNYFTDSGEFINTFVVVLIDMLGSLVYFKLYLEDYRRDIINYHYTNKNRKKLYKKLLDKNINKKIALSLYKMLIFLIVMLILIIYYNLSNIFGNAKYIRLSNAIDFAMFYMSIIVCNILLEGGHERIKYNLKLIKSYTKRFSLINYLIIIGVVFYQLYSLISNIKLLIAKCKI